MKLTAKQMMDKFNTKLLDHNQQTRVISYTNNSITLSTGTTLLNNDKTRFCKRLMNNKTTIWADNIDNLLLGKIDEKEIRSKLSSLGGKAVQKKHGDAIKQNLNTGTPWNAGTKGQNIGTKGHCSQLTKDKISLKNSGTGNGMYGAKMSASAKLAKSEWMKQKILSGEFTPNSNNRNTHWDSTFDGKRYRSSWEALYQFFNQSAEYESLRIEYTVNNDTKIYIVDFVDHQNKLVVEVKPRELCLGEKFNLKFDALRRWAAKNGYEALIVDRAWLKSNITEIDYSRFDDNTVKKIKKFYETY